MSEKSWAAIEQAIETLGIVPRPQARALAFNRIGLVRGPAGFRSAAEREKGLPEALEGAGLTLAAEFNEAGNYRFIAGTEAGKKLLSLTDQPTATFCSNDEMAAGMINAAHGKGIAVPAQLSIISFDDSPTASHIWPALSTFRWPMPRNVGGLAS